MTLLMSNASFVLLLSFFPEPLGVFSPCFSPFVFGVGVLNLPSNVFCDSFGAV